MNLNTKYYLNLNHGYIQTFYKPKSEPFIKFPGIYLYNFKIKLNNNAYLNDKFLKTKDSLKVCNYYFHCIKYLRFIHLIILFINYNE